MKGGNFMERRYGPVDVLNVKSEAPFSSILSS